MQKINDILPVHQPGEEASPAYNNTVLTQDEIDTALLEAKKAKFWRFEEQRILGEKKAAREEALRPWATDELYRHAKKEAERLAAISGKTYVMDECLAPAFSLLCHYFSNNPAFEQDGRSLAKGIMLLGNVGVGKTDLLKAFRRNKRQCFLPVTTNQVEEQCRLRGLQYADTFVGAVPGHGNTAEYFFQPQVGWMFDDLGTESIIKLYGNELEVMEKTIHQRYMLKHTVPFSSMHITTNLDGNDIEQRYGYRMRSRMREMFNIIRLSGEDRR